jgi:hypothetical protein
MMRAALAKAWGGISPIDLRGATLAEISAMTEVLEEHTRAMEQAARL